MTQELLEELLLTWENSQGSESPLTPEEVCCDCPHLLSELKRRIEALAELSPFLGSRQIAGRARDAKVEVRQQHRSEAVHSAIEPTDRDPSTHSRFVNLRAHARGGLGEVFRARDTSLNRDVALKVIRAPHDRDPLRRRRFLREAAITGMLEHPGIVPVHGVGTDDAGRPCYTMRFIEGRTLQSAIDQHFSSSMTADESIRNRRKLLQRFITVCNTVAYAHSRGVIHRDLKPANILLGSFDDTLVVDWGLAKRVDVDEQSSKSPAESKLAPALPPVEQWDVDTSIDDIPATILDDASAASSAADQVTNDYVPVSSVDVPLTGALRVLGTPGYMSPEQTRDSSNLTYASDVFSLGAILYAMLTGRPPYASKSIAAILDDAKHARFPAPSTVDSRVPRALDAICLKAMCVRPEDRYASALELADDVERWLSDEPVSVSRESLSERVLRTARKHKSWTQAAAIFLSLLTVVSVIFAFLMWGQIQETRREKNNALQLAAEKSKLAEAERELRTLAEKLADEKDKLAESERKSRKLADDESRAALKTLSSVVTSLQKKLVDIPGTDVVRRELLTSAVDGLKKVADSLAVRDDADFYTCAAHREIALILLRVGDSVEGNGSEQALAHLAKASEISERLRSMTPDNLAVQRQLSRYLRVAWRHLHASRSMEDPAMEAYQRSLSVSPMPSLTRTANMPIGIWLSDTRKLVTSI
ncbi:MAG: protein kinase [Pirellulales bacterium]